MKTGGSFLTTPVCTQPTFTREKFSEEQQEIGKTVEEFARERIRPNKQEIEKYNKDLSLELLRECGEMGLLSVDIPEEYDGMGLGKVTSAIVVENLSAGMCASFATTFGAHTGIGTLPTVFFGTDAQKKKYLPKLGSAEWVAAYALTEPDAGSDATSAKTTAQLSEDGKYYILNGTKQFITNAEWAQLFTTFANVDGNFTAFLVDRDSPGLSIGPEEKKMGVKGSSTCSVYLEDAKVPVENMLGKVGGGAAVAFNSLNIGRFKLGAAALGGCKVVMAEALQYASERRQFGQPIRNFEMLKGYFADMVVDIFALDSIVYRTIGLIDEAIAAIPHGAPDYNRQVAAAIEQYAIEASMVKVFGSEAMAAVADMGLQIFGGNGFIEEYPMAGAVRDTRIDRIWEGSNEINRQIIAGYFLKKALLEDLPIRESTKEIHRDGDLPGPPAATADDLLAAEKHAVENARRLAVYAFDMAISTFGQDLTNRQMVGAALSDIFTDIYVLSSSLSRFSQQEDASVRNEWLPVVRTLCAEGVARIASQARNVLTGSADGDYLKTALRKWSEFQNDMMLDSDIFALKNEIAEDLYAA